jgi:hypothetical protein
MSQAQWQDELRIPTELTAQLRDFRRRVWTIKLIEAIAVAASGLLIAFLSVFALDRLVDTSPWVRAAIGVLAFSGCGALLWFVRRWIWRCHRLDQLACLLSLKLPRIGDQLLGIIELANNRWEQHRSRALCQAAIEQVSEDARGYDFRVAMPNARVRTWLGVAVTLLFAAALVAELFPQAAGNAWMRLVRPWEDTPRFTFAALEPMPEEMVVAHGELFTLTAKLAADSQWQPGHARAQLADEPPVDADLLDGSYRFEFPPQLEAGRLAMRVGDATMHIQIKPMLRPELTSIVAKVRLPDYLGQQAIMEKDIRSGAISLVKGSRLSIMPTVNRPLVSAQANGTDCRPTGATFSTAEFEIEDPQQIQLKWQDELGLTCKEPFKVAVTAQDDEAPQLTCEDLPRNRVILDTEQLVFHVRARDDFGVKNVGMEWKGIPSDMVDKPAAGQCNLAAGGCDKAALDVEGTFTAKSLGIEPQPIELRIFATDYYPDRKPVYTAPYTFFVLNAEQHAIWITEQLAKWQRQSLEIRDRELQLYEANKKLREMSDDELDRPETRRQIERQADAERVNGRRLANLTETGKDLLRQAARNPEIGVGHLDKWAEMLQILADIAANRMPSVADLLKTASQAPSVAAAAIPADNRPSIGQARAAGAGEASDNKPSERSPAKAAVPRIVDTESSQEPQNPLSGSPPKDGKPSSPSLHLPVTTLIGKAMPKPSAPNSPAQDKVDKAVTAQRDLLAEFEKVANELNTVLANLEGSTLMKRLKAASRQQYAIAGKINDHIDDAFGRAKLAPVLDPDAAEIMNRRSPAYAAAAAAPPERAPLGGEVGKTLAGLSRQEEEGVQKISYIMDDMAAYFDRRRLVKFKTVLDDMRKQDVLGGLRQLTDDIPRKQGLSISQCEYWSDTLDRWAEDLVDPACSGACPGCRCKGCLPPSIVLEVLKILEGEINLREETRVAEQAKPAEEVDKYGAEAARLSATQHQLQDRVVAVIGRIRELPDAESDFAKDLALLAQVNDVMKDATGILAGPETGAPAIAAETDAIELLLKSRRINPNSGGGGGANPGGGGTGTTQDTALALLGAGLNQKEVREHQGTEQSVGETGPVWPEEFRAGLDQYFSGLESRTD